MFFKKSIIFFLILFSLNASAYTVFTDTFSGYNNYWKLVSDTNNANKGWDINIAPSDTNVIRTDTNGVRFGTSAIQVETNFTDENWGFSNLYLITNPNNPQAGEYVDLSDYNASGRLYYWAKIDGNVTMQRQFSLRCGTTNGTVNKYWSYYNTDGAPYGEAFFRGYNLIVFDINSADDKAPSGGPPTDLTQVNFCGGRNSYNYSGGVTDINWTMNQMWVEKVNGSTNGVWKQDFNGTRPYGWSRPSLEGTNYVFNIAPTDRTYNWKLGIVTIPQIGMPYVNSLDNNISAQFDIKQIDANMKTQILFDRNSFSNYNSVFLSNVNKNSATVGVESYVNGVRSFNSSTISLDTNSFHTLKFFTDNNNVAVYIDNILVHDGNVLNRNVGSFGIDSNNGQTVLDNVSIVFLRGNETIPTSPISNNYFNILLEVFLPLGLLLSILGIVVYQQPELDLLIGEVLGILLTYLILHAMLGG